jgi:8-amino-7-oxononanoate synthase
LGKAAGISGAFVAGHKTLVEWILQKGRPYIYTTASPPALAHGLLKSLELISDNSYRTALNHNIQYWKKTLRLKKWVLMPSDTAIQPIMIGKTEDALQVAQHLYKKEYLGTSDQTSDSAGQHRQTAHHILSESQQRAD